MTGDCPDLCCDTNPLLLSDRIRRYSIVGELHYIPHFWSEATQHKGSVASTQIYLVMHECSKTPHNASQAVRLPRIYAADIPAFVQSQYPALMLRDSPHLWMLVQFPFPGTSANTEWNQKKAFTWLFSHVFTLLPVDAITVVCTVAFTSIRISVVGLRLRSYLARGHFKHLRALVIHAFTGRLRVLWSLVIRECYSFGNSL